MNRSDFKKMAQIRLRDANALLKSRNYSGAYYLCGYVVECALKACIAKKTRRYEFPDKKFAEQCYVHDLTKLVAAAEQKSNLDVESKHDPAFAVNWGIAKDWSEESRYKSCSRVKAQNLYDAVADQMHGVLQWVKRFW
jgi:HEPN domain-containing protein